MMSHRFCLLFACGLLSTPIASASAQSFAFTTIAGQPGNVGSADGTNNNARFNYPSCIAVDGSGNLYVSDVLNHTIRKIQPVGSDWVVTTIAGSPGVPGTNDGVNSQALFNRPNGLGLDSQGNLFVADHYNHTIRKMTPDGTNWIVSTIAGTPGNRGSGLDGTNDQARFWSPTGLAVDGGGRLYVVDTLNFTIRGITAIGSDWVTSTLAGTPLNYGFADGVNDLAEFNYPYCVAVGNGGPVYITDWGNGAIREVTPSGTDWVVTTIAGGPGPAGSQDGPGARATFNDPNGIAIDQENNLYVSDQSNHTIRKLTPSQKEWTVSTIGGMPLQAGSTDGIGADARFKKPWGITVDKVGNLYIVDYLNHSIRKGSPQVATAPVLQISAVGGALVLTWPASASNYVLEAISAVSPGTPWTPITNGITASPDDFSLTTSPSSSSAFYRLRRN